LQALKRFVLVKYANDISIIPNESTHFGFSDSGGKSLKMEETETFQRDCLGLKQMKTDGKLIMLEAPMEHLELDKEWFRENILPVLRET
jgi:palmitoyl-protein thioesterase